MNLADRIRCARRGRYTQAELAKAIGATQPMVSKLERGITTETSLLIAIARVTGVRPEWLESGDGPMRAEPSQQAAEDRPSYVADSDRLALLIHIANAPADEVARLAHLAHTHFPAQAAHAIPAHTRIGPPDTKR